jgi:hypothetical protein
MTPRKDGLTNLISPQLLLNYSTVVVTRLTLGDPRKHRLPLVLNPANCKYHRRFDDNECRRHNNPSSRLGESKRVIVGKTERQIQSIKVKIWGHFRKVNQ